MVVHSSLGVSADLAPGSQEEMFHVLISDCFCQSNALPF